MINQGPSTCDTGVTPIRRGLKIKLSDIQVKIGPAKVMTV